MMWISRRAFGDVGKVDAVGHLVGTAVGWGRNREEDAMYDLVRPARNDGQTPPAPFRAGIKGPSR